VFSKFFFVENRSVYEVLRENIVEPDRPRMAIWRMRITCWIPKATNTPSEYVILIDFPLQQWLHERASVLRYVSHYLYCSISTNTGICLQILVEILNLNFRENPSF